MDKDRVVVRNGSLPEALRYLRKEIPDFDERCRNYWLAWKKMMDQRMVTRMGYVKMHFYNFDVQTNLPPEMPFSDADHVFGLINAVLLFRDFFGKFIPIYYGFQPDWLGYIEQVAFHEIGEIEIGDWTDDGSNDRKEKDRLEQEAFDNFMRLFPEVAEKNHQNQFADLRDGKTNMKLFDKASFVLGVAYLKTKGIVGSLKRKDSITEQDRASCEEIRSYRAIDHIFAGLLRKFRDFSFTPFIVGIVEAIYAEEYNEDDHLVTNCIPGAPPAGVRKLY